MMTRSEAGKLGGIQLAKKHLDQYNLNPKGCKSCSRPISYHQRKNTFCSDSCYRRACSDRISNNGSPRKRKISIDRACLNCESKFTLRTPNDTKKYCNLECSFSYQVKQVWADIESGLIDVRSTLKKHLIQRRGHECEGCQNTIWKTSLFNDSEVFPIPLELDHIDGDASNNIPSNLRLLCPTCHSLTPTAKGKNRGNGRSTRGLPKN